MRRGRLPERAHVRLERWIWRIAEPCFWMRLANCRWQSRRNFCGCWRSGGLNAWRDTVDRRGCAHRGGYESRLAEIDRREIISRGFVFPNFGGADDHSSLARARRGCADAGAALFGEIQPRVREARTGTLRGREGEAPELPLAGQRSRTSEYSGARRDLGGRDEHSRG